MRKPVLFALAVVLSFACVAEAQAQQIYWKQKPLLWSTGGTTRNFTASLVDTAFVTLPTDIAWDVVKQYTGVNVAVSVGFTSSTPTANADSVHYAIEHGVGGVFNFVALKDPTVAATNVAVKTYGAGRAMFGILTTDGTTFTADKMLPWRDVRLKVGGDPDGAFTALKCFIFYPSYIAN